MKTIWIPIEEYKLLLEFQEYFNNKTAEKLAKYI